MLSAASSQARRSACRRAFLRTLAALIVSGCAVYTVPAPHAIADSRRRPAALVCALRRSTERVRSWRGLTSLETRCSEFRQSGLPEIGFALPDILHFEPNSPAPQNLYTTRIGGAVSFGGVLGNDGRHLWRYRAGPRYRLVVGQGIRLQISARRVGASLSGQDGGRLRYDCVRQGDRLCLSGLRCRATRASMRLSVASEGPGSLTRRVPLTFSAGDQRPGLPRAP